jgi:hypothetical protein
LAGCCDARVWIAKPMLQTTAMVYCNAVLQCRMLRRQGQGSINPRFVLVRTIGMVF